MKRFLFVAVVLCATATVAFAQRFNIESAYIFNGLSTGGVILQAPTLVSDQTFTFPTLGGTLITNNSGWTLLGNTLTTTGQMGSLNTFNVELIANGSPRLVLLQSTNALQIPDAGELRFMESAPGGNYTAFKAGTQGADITYTLPTSAPTASQVLRANGTTPTDLEWVTLTSVTGGTTIGTTLVWNGSAWVENTSLNGVVRASSGVLSAGYVNLTSEVTGILPVANGGTNSSTALNNNRMMVSSGGAIVEAAALTDGQIFIGSTGNAPLANEIDGTTDQIIVTNGPGTITLSTPQNIATTSSPSFASLTLSRAVTPAELRIVEETSLGGQYTAFVAGDQTANITYRLPLTAPTANQVLRANATTPTDLEWASLVSVLAGTSADNTLRWSGTAWVENAGVRADASNNLNVLGNLDVDGTATIGSLNGVVRASAGVLSTGNVNLTSEVTGTLPVANGGTNSSTALNNNRMIVSSGGAIVEGAALTDGQIFIGSTGNAPVANEIDGTTDQVIVTNGAGTITLSTPQNIATTSSPSFAALTLSNTGTPAELRIVEETSGGGEYSAFVAGNQTANITYRLPLTAPTALQVLQANATTPTDLEWATLVSVVAGTTPGTTLVWNGTAWIENTSLTGVVRASSGVLSAGNVNLATEVTGVLPIANGGTNSSTALNNNRIMVSSGGAIVEGAALTNGQIFIGSTGNAPVAASLTGGNGIAITPGAGSITIAADVAGSGTTGRLTRWTASNTIGDGSLSDNGTGTLSRTGDINLDATATLYLLGSTEVVAYGGAVSLRPNGNVSLDPVAGDVNIDIPATYDLSIFGLQNNTNTTNFLVMNGNDVEISTVTIATVPLGGLTASRNVRTDGTGSLTTGPIALGGGSNEVSGTLPIANGGTNSSTALNNNRIMVSSGGAIQEAAALVNGQILIGSTGAAPVAASLTGGNGITVTPGAGSITIAADVAGSGTAGRLTRWTASNAIGDGSLSDNGTGTLSRTGDINLNATARLNLFGNTEVIVYGGAVTLQPAGNVRLDPSAGDVIINLPATHDLSILGLQNNTNTTNFLVMNGNDVEISTVTVATVPIGGLAANRNVRTDGTGGLTVGPIALDGGPDEVSGALPITNGGTGLTALGTANQMLRVNGAGTALEYFTVALLPSTGTNNYTLRWNGSAWAESGALQNNGTDIAMTGALDVDGNFNVDGSAVTFTALPTTTTAGDLLTIDGSNVVRRITTANVLGSSVWLVGGNTAPSSGRIGITGASTTDLELWVNGSQAVVLDDLTKQVSINNDLLVNENTTLGEEDADQTTIRGSVNINTTTAGGLNVNINTSTQANTTTIGSSTASNTTALNSPVISMPSVPTTGFSATDKFIMRDASNNLRAGQLSGTTNQISIIAAGGGLQISTPQDIAPSNSPTFVSMTLNGSSNQLTLGTTTTTTLTAPATGTARTYTIPDVGGTTASFVMTESAQTINGSKSFRDNTVVGGGSTAAELQITEASGTGGQYSAFKAGNQSANITYTLPTTAPTANQVLRANSATPTNLEWATPSSSSAPSYQLITAAVTSASTTYSTGMTVAAAASTTYLVEIRLTFSTSDNASDPRFRFNIPSGATLSYGYSSSSPARNESYAGHVTAATTATTLDIGNNQDWQTVHITAVLTMSTTAGDCILEISRSGGTGTVTLAAGASMKLTPL